MRKSLHFLISVLLSIYFILIIFGSSHQSERLELIISITKKDFILGEPIILTISLHSVKRGFIPLLLNRNLIYEVILPNGQQIRGGGGGETGYCGPIHPKIPFEFIDAGSTLVTETNLLDEVYHMSIGKEVGRYEVTVILDTRWYTLKEPKGVFSGRISSNTLNFEIIKPTGIDAQVFELIKQKANKPSGSLAFVFAVNPDLCEHVLRDFPTSTYAKYACFYLAKYYHHSIEQTWHHLQYDRERMNRLMKPGLATYDYLIKAIELYQKVLNEYPKFALSGQAQFGLAHCYFLKGELEVARKEANRTLQQYPNSFASQEARKLLQEIEKK